MIDDIDVLSIQFVWISFIIIPPKAIGNGQD